MRTVLVVCCRSMTIQDVRMGIAVSKREMEGKTIFIKSYVISENEEFFFPFSQSKWNFFCHLESRNFRVGRSKGWFWLLCKHFQIWNCSYIAPSPQNDFLPKKNFFFEKTFFDWNFFFISFSASFISITFLQ